MFEVYVGRVGADVVYVGCGKKGRHKHLNSGTSHIYEANKLHFEGKYIFVQVIPITTQEESRKVELEFIKKYNPLWNKTHNGPRIKKTHTPCSSEVEFYSVKHDGERPPNQYRTEIANIVW